MPLRFRRTFKIFPGVKVNVSKGGISTTVGFKGFHLNFSRRGIQRTIDFPGRGFTHAAFIKRNEPDDNDDERRRRSASRETRERDRQPPRPDREDDDDNNPISCVVPFLALVTLGCIAGSMALGWIPRDFISNALAWLTQWVQKTGF
jgi:hypothetical protein